jgi:hypothetical protein
MEHLLAKSESSGRLAYPEFIVECALSHKKVLTDEVEASAVTGNFVLRELLQTSAISGQKAEPEHFGRCAFTRVAGLKGELATSEFSNKQFRLDEQMQSAASRRIGHRQDFTVCEETGQPIALVEAERCEVTGKVVRPGILQTCEASGKKVLASELARSAATGRKVLKTLLVRSSVSGEPLLPDEAIRSSKGRYCLPTEAESCFWSGRLSHPDDMRRCAFSRLPIYFEYADSKTPPRLKVLGELLDGVRRTNAEQQEWDEIERQLQHDIGGKCAIEGASLAPTGRHIAACAEF